MHFYVHYLSKKSIDSPQSDHWSLEELLLLDQQHAERVLHLLLLQGLETPPAHLVLVQGLSALKELLEGTKFFKEVLLLVLELPVRVFLHQLLYLPLHHCKLQSQVALARQHLQDFTETEAVPDNKEKRPHVRLSLGGLSDVANLLIFDEELEFVPLAGEVTEVVFHGLLVGTDEVVELCPVDLVEEGDKEHAIDAELIAVDGGFDALDDGLVVGSSSQESIDLGGVGLPVEGLALVDDVGDVLEVELVDQGPDFVGLADPLLVVVVLIQAVGVQLGQFLYLLELLALGLHGGQPLIQLELLQYFHEVAVGLVVALVSSSFVVFQHFVFMLHIGYLITKPLMSQTKGMKRAVTMSALELWHDVQDESGVWRVGFCERKEATYKVISLDGFHPSHTSFYCEHTEKVLPVRTKTMGLTVPEHKTIRAVLKLKEIDQVCGKMSLFQLITSQLDNTPEKIRIFIRTELLIFIDRVFNTPFELLATMKLVDIHINKLFMITIEYYFKLLESSKRFVSLLDSNETARQLYRASYEMAHVIAMVLGVHKRSKALYDSPINRTIKCEGILDYFIKYEGGGILPFKLFFKNISALKTVEKEDLTICLETVNLFISLCEKYQSEFVDGKIQSLSRIILDEIINLIQVFCEKKPEIANQFKTKVELISRIETLHFKLFPNKQCDLRKLLEGQKEKDKDKSQNFIRELQNVKSMARMKSELHLNLGKVPKSIEKEKEKESEKVRQLQQKLNRLESTLSKLQVVNIHEQEVVVERKEQVAVQPTDNLGEQAFLGSLEWALDAGDMVTCRKLVQWRKSLLKLGRITGWEIALAVGMKTFRSKEILPEDIIEANYDFIIKVNGMKEQGVKESGMKG